MTWLLVEREITAVSQKKTMELRNEHRMNAVLGIEVLYEITVWQ